jgi:hypothetical protein
VTSDDEFTVGLIKSNVAIETMRDAVGPDLYRAPTRCCRTTSRWENEHGSLPEPDH